MRKQSHLVNINDDRGFILVGSLITLMLIIVLLAFTPWYLETLAPIDQPSQRGDEFWWGILHGFTAPLNFLLNLFVEEVAIRQAGTSGNAYSIGYVSGLLSAGTAGFGMVEGLKMAIRTSTGQH